MATVNIKQGLLKGGVSKTENGTEYYEFLEIPYAKPPVGDLRFKSPQPPVSWEGERLATSATKVSVQSNITQSTVISTEDCLYLNVYSPKISSPDAKLPVMVYIHGGGFVVGNGIIKDDSGPDYFMIKDVVVVSINYRLGIFGFLALDIPEAAGNMGLKDQVMALKWVQNNIEHFGGDKNNVTVFGISAGAAAIEYLIISPQAKGLFHKAILQSGSTLNHWAINFEPKSLAYKLAQELGFKGPKIDYRGIYHHIFKQSTEAIQSCYTKITSNTNLRTTPGFVPSLEKDLGDNDAFLTEKPYILLKQGKINKVIVLRGFCDTEGFLTKVFKPFAVKELQESKNFLQHWPYKIEDINLNEKLKRAYINDANIKDFAIDLFTDFDFVAGIWLASKFMVDFGMPLYMYEFSYDGEANFFKSMFGVTDKGCSHGDDIAYILKVSTVSLRSETDKLIRDRFIAMWTNFAKSGNPTPQTDSLLPLTWPTFRRDKMSYLNIDKELTIKSNYEPTKMEIFKDIYNKYNM